MMPSPQPKAQMSWLELALKLIATLFLGYLFINYVIAFHSLQLMNPDQLKPAEQALTAHKDQVAFAALDSYLNTNHRSAPAYSVVMELCARNKRPDLVKDYAARGAADLARASQEERASFLRAEASAYLECGPPSYPLARQTAEQADQLSPDSVESMNLLSYTLAEVADGPNALNDLLRAQKLIQEALKQINSQVGSEAKLNLGIYEDTYGWVLYKLALYGPAAESSDRYDQAANVLLLARNDMPDGAPDVDLREFFYHLGAAYARTNRPTQARSTLLIALHYDANYEPALKELEALPKETAEH